MITARWHPWKCQKYAESSPTSIHHLINVTGYHEISAEGIVLNLFAVLSWHVRRWNYCVSYCRLKCWNTWGIHNYWSMYGRINKWSHFIQSRLVGGLSLHYWPDNKNLIYIYWLIMDVFFSIIDLCSLHVSLSVQLCINYSSGSSLRYKSAKLSVITIVSRIAGY